MPEVLTKENKEKKEILNKYRGLLRDTRYLSSKEDRRKIRKAFNYALRAHEGMRRKSGEPYIFHPIAVARILAKEVKLDTVSIICALLHDTVEDTKVTLKDIQKEFGATEAKIIEGLTKISGYFDPKSSPQAENFRKMLLSLSEDIRVILIKLTDRLHNMRTLTHMARDKQIKIASETLYLYAPLAHRLGLYKIKSELEDLAFKYKEPAKYEEIRQKLKKTEAVRRRFINRFSYPIKNRLNREGYKFELKGRTKSIYSINQKLENKQVPFEEIYDVFAIRLIIDVPKESEKAECWKVYSIVTDYYKPNPDRLRDWISTPKANGYEALHTTVMSPTGKWVEVQIRSSRMDEIAEKGYAAHWRYKENKWRNRSMEEWMNMVREVLENAHGNAVEMMDDIKMDLVADEIFVFTPKGELKPLPVNATALDLAFNIHTDIGEKCIGAKVNHKLVPLNHKLKSGDQVEVLTSKAQRPKDEWVHYVETAKARSKIRAALKKEKKRITQDGKERLERKFNNLKVDLTEENIKTLVELFNVNDSHELFYRIAKNALDLKKIRKLSIKSGKLYRVDEEQKQKGVEQNAKEKEQKESKPQHIDKKDTLIIGEGLKSVGYKLAPCCNPIPGDDVFGFVTSSDGVKIHRVTCPNATQLLSNHAERVLKAKWASQEKEEFMAGIKFTGTDDVGVVNNITHVISDDLNVNMSKVSFESNAGKFNGEVKVLVYDTVHLDNLIKKLQRVNGVHFVERMRKE